MRLVDNLIPDLEDDPTGEYCVQYTLGAAISVSGVHPAERCRQDRTWRALSADLAVESEDGVIIVLEYINRSMRRTYRYGRHDDDVGQGKC